MSLAELVLVPSGATGDRLPTLQESPAKLSGVDVGKLLPIPDISNKRFPEAAKHEARGLHRILFQFSPEDYPRAGEIWNGPHPEDGSELELQVGAPRVLIRPTWTQSPS